MKATIQTVLPLLKKTSPRDLARWAEDVPVQAALSVETRLIGLEDRPVIVATWKEER